MNVMDVVAPIVVLMDVFVLIVALVTAQFLGAWGDRRRIHKHFRSLGGHVLTIHGRQSVRWWGNWSSRIYEVRSRDINGQEHCALYRTGFWLGTWKYSPLTELQNRA